MNKQRENLRKTYDHYDEKMEKIVKHRFEKVNKGISETPSDEKKFERVNIFLIFLIFD